MSFTELNTVLINKAAQCITSLKYVICILPPFLKAVKSASDHMCSTQMFYVLTVI